MLCCILLIPIINCKVFSVCERRIYYSSCWNNSFLFAFVKLCLQGLRIEFTYRRPLTSVCADAVWHLIKPFQSLVGGREGEGSSWKKPHPLEQRNRKTSGAVGIIITTWKERGKKKQNSETKPKAKSSVLHVRMPFQWSQTNKQTNSNLHGGGNNSEQRVSTSISGNHK